MAQNKSSHIKPISGPFSGSSNNLENEASFNGAFTATTLAAPDADALARPGALTVDGSVDASMQSIGETDWFQIQLTAGETYSFTENGLSQAVRLNISVPSAALDNPVYTSESGLKGSTVQFTFTADTTGAYDLGVADLIGVTGAYTVSAATVADTHTLLNPGALIVGGAVKQDMQSSGDSDWFSIDLTAGTTYFFTERGLSQSASLSISPTSAASDTSIETFGRSKTKSTEEYVFTADSTGSYDVRVYDDGGATGLYTVTTSSETAHDTVANPGALIVGGSVDGYNYGDTGWFKVNLTAGTTYSFTEYGLGPFAQLAIVPSSEAADTLAGVYSSRRRQPASTKQITFTADTTGSYDLGVYNFGGGYTIATAIVPDKYTLASPGVLTVGGTVNAVLQSKDETDWFSVDLIAGKTYAFTEAGLAQYPYFDISSASTASDSSVTQDFSGQLGTTTQFTFTADTTGSYDVRVADRSGKIGAYTVSTAVVPDTYTLAHPSVLRLGGSVDASMQSLGDTNWFRLRGIAGRTYMFTETGLSQDTYLSIYPSSEATDTSNAPFISAKSGATVQLTFTADTTGVYDVEVIDGGGVIGAYTMTTAVAPDSYTLGRPGALTAGSQASTTSPDALLQAAAAFSSASASSSLHTSYGPDQMQPIFGASEGRRSYGFNRAPLHPTV